MASPLLLTKRLVGASLFLGALSHTAFAFEAEDVAAALKAQLDRQQVELEWEAVRQDGSSVILEGATAGGKDAKGTLPLGEIHLEEVSETDAGYRIENLDIASLSHETDDVKVSLSGLSINGLILAKDGATDPYGGALRYERFAVEHAEARDGDDALLGSVDGLYTEMSISDDEAMEVVGGGERFAVDVTTLPEGENPRKAMQELGYEELTGSLDLSGRWRPSDGQLLLDRYALTLDNGGTLVLAGEISGYTPEFIKTMTEMAEKMKDDSQGSNQGMAMLGMMQQLSFHRLSIRFNDDSLSNKLLDLAASKQGGKPEDVIAQAQMIIPMQLSPFLGSELTSEVTQAVTTFLKSPENIEISAMPSAPVPFAMLMGAAMGAPEMLAKQVGLTVKANQ